MIRSLLSVLGPAHAAPLRRMIGVMALASVLQGLAFALLVPVLRALLGPSPADAWPWLAVFAAVALAQSLAAYAAQVAGYRAGSTLSRGLHHRLGDHIASLPLGFFTGDRVGKLGQLTSGGVINVMQVPAHLLRPLIDAVLTPATVVALMYLFDWRLALAATLSAPVLYFVYQWSGALIQRTDRGRDLVIAEAGGRVVEFAQTQPVLRAFGRTVQGYRLLDEALVAQRDAGRRMITTGVWGLVGFGLVVQAAFTVLLVLGVSLALGGSLGVPELLALLVLAARFVEPLAMAADLGGVIRLGRNALHRMTELLAAPLLPEPAAPRKPGDASIELVDVSFGYDSRPVLSNVSLRVPPRSMTALVGPSGSGKTTVTRLIARFFDVDSGSVRVGGVDVREIAGEQLMSLVSLVFQDVYLFEGSIEENIRVGRPGASEEQVRAAARLARVEEIVERLPGGWSARIGEGGVTLSGGERQRISIARAILKDAPIVLLDEATAALDPENESAVQDALTALTADRTLLVIAHRLQTVVAADQIVVLEAGRVAESGTHEELLTRGGRYAEFWAERNRAHGWRLLPTR
ncbi:ABC transporter ATP-binding protein/permease [Crossiella sp. SN42]|uniref:ABC transporter ATP-binding protein n=1 Tax=Crossiella sp. SN42 TaxID=2944808 RepID=UPI00207C941C|nr:ABC transporter ATP-binding protein [Crossiella sp. SN42]MCO1574876.1 ABC transporter ATP-binding protein/permease [Crossiella sp. SN42]